MRLPAFLALGNVSLALQVNISLDAIARDLQAVESVRVIKDVTSTYAQLAQVGRWEQMASLFSEDGLIQWDRSIAKGQVAIERWLKTESGDMDGLNPGSLSAMVLANPLVNLASDSKSAKARYNGWWFQGDGKGKTRLQGGIYENEYKLGDDGWKISLLRYYPLYNGTYVEGWHNPGGQSLGNVPYHFTSDESGIPIPPPTGSAPKTDLTPEDLARRIAMLNDEDEVRNVQHAYGYYVDRRMWADVVDLFPTGNASFQIDKFGTFTERSGIRQGLEKWMGPEGLSQGVLNDRLIFNTMVHIHPRPMENGNQQALTRGLEIGIVGDANNTAGAWQFNLFYNRFIKEDGIWKLKDVRISPLVVANYSTGWVSGSTSPLIAEKDLPPFLDYTRKESTLAGPPFDGTSTDLAELQRRLSKSAAYDGVENVSNAYGFYIDFIDGVGCTNMANIHARKGNKESPFAGFYQTRERVLKACTQYYGTNATLSRKGISFHWRPQPVILVSQDGRSASLRARLLQPSTDRTGDGLLRGAIYHDQMILEDGIWRLWSVTIDEFYWTSSKWKDGWPGVKARAPNATNPADRDLTKQYPPDLLLTEIGAPRETGFQGGVGRFTTWPEILRMWFAYRNLVSGRVPDSYWPGCVPCHHRPAWNLTSNGYQEPPTGPTILTAQVAPATADQPAKVTVKVSAGPGEPVTGVVRLDGDIAEPLSVTLTEAIESEVVFSLAAWKGTNPRGLTARYLGSDRLKPGQVSFRVM
ncbi:hypothetical protein GQ53DRAFT_860609 [Thozetella sp. PMI_491]|nr:hypothetical protein GQ53DRAFT_860609 [Thozetella sp. PMI_491]